jgi:hypothetical protein
MESAASGRTRSWQPAIGLFFVAPLVAEYLLGDLSIRMLSALVILAPAYGCGALLIREVVRRCGRGWPSILILALAYGIVGEGFSTQTLFNPDAFLLHLHLLAPGFIPALGIGAWWTVFVLALHTIWSISVSIALVEATVPDRAEIPWLGPVGLAVSVVLYVLGMVLNTWIQYRQGHFVASRAQFGWSAAIVVCLVVGALLLPRTKRAEGDGFTPNPWLCAVLGLAAGSAILLMPPRWGWWAAIGILAVEAGGFALIFAWSRQSGWGAVHKLALAGGAAMAYAWHSFVGKPVVGPRGIELRIGNAIFTLGALALIAYGAKKSAACLSPEEGTEGRESK